jgi:hypothetical protein
MNLEDAARSHHVSGGARSPDARSWIIRSGPAARLVPLETTSRASAAYSSKVVVPFERRQGHTGLPPRPVIRRGSRLRASPDTDSTSELGAILLCVAVWWSARTPARYPS